MTAPAFYLPSGGRVQTARAAVAGPFLASDQAIGGWKATWRSHHLEGDLDTVPSGRKLS